MMPLINLFPSPHNATEDGLLCVGGILTADSVWDAYQKGIFPWYNTGEPIQWWCPDPRFVLFPHKLNISKSMHKLIKSGQFTFSVNKHFTEVIHHCRHTLRNGESGSWITDEMTTVYTELHQQGKAMSAECTLNGKLVGGLYGVCIPPVFCGESMFSHVSNASKFAFISMVTFLQNHGISLIDCQIYSKHLESLGAEMIPRDAYLKILQAPI